ncbi:hypothetical protein AB1Y20_021845 [Prymnesium parvum]|uniref:Glutaredoxin domain-containing protein n=1 Tax=Prymnesium parvum TaxID=97485 RepID=A0AB34JLS2_PRYPA
MAPFALLFASLPAAMVLRAPPPLPTPLAHASARVLSPRMLEAATEAQIQKLIDSSPVVLFMKGNKLFPQCGFSNTAVQILNSMNVPYEVCDVLENPAIREGIKEYSSWPTIPQCYVNGEFIGGCDLMIEMYQSGELQEMVERAAAEA